MADYTIKQNDTGPFIEVTLEDAQGPVDLSAATSVTMNMEHENSTKILGIVMTEVTDGTDGKFSHQWTPEAGETPPELSIPGEWTAEFKVIVEGRRTTFPSEGRKSIVIEEEIA